MRRLAVASFVVLIVGVMASPTLAAHNGNNKAELSGPTGATGNAIVNYSEGTGAFNSSVNTSGLQSGTYSFTVSLNGGNVQLVCNFAVDGSSREGCSDQGRRLTGFNRAEIRDASGSVVASGLFARRGNCRDADQAGSQCEANGAPGQTGSSALIPISLLGLGAATVTKKVRR
jgi:hypothetical protein